MTSAVLHLFPTASVFYLSVQSPLPLPQLTMVGRWIVDSSGGSLVISCRVLSEVTSYSYRQYSLPPRPSRRNLNGRYSHRSHPSPRSSLSFLPLLSFPTMLVLMQSLQLDWGLEMKDIKLLVSPPRFGTRIESSCCCLSRSFHLCRSSRRSGTFFY